MSPTTRSIAITSFAASVKGALGQKTWVHRDMSLRHHVIVVQVKEFKFIHGPITGTGDGLCFEVAFGGIVLLGYPTFLKVFEQCGEWCHFDSRSTVPIKMTMN
jgi:hypothetical protein